MDHTMPEWSGQSRGDRHPDSGRVALLFATSGHSGVDRVVSNLVREFASVDCSFDLLTIHGHGPHIRDLPGNVRPVRLRAAHRDTALAPLICYLRRVRPRALLTAHHRLNRCALIARHISRVPCRVVLRMGMSPQGTRDKLGRRAAAGRLRSMRRWYHRAQALITPSQGVGRAMVDLGCIDADQLRVIPNPIVNDRLARLAESPVVHPWFGDGGTPVVLGAGALIPRKDFATLIRAFARIRAVRPARLIILGEGRERGGLEALATSLGVRGDCDLPGHVENPYPYMAAADVFALSSRAEGSGAVLIEALACGTSAVATDCHSGPSETLGHGAFGPLVAVGDDGALAEAIEALLDRPTPAAAREQAVAPFAAQRSAARYLAALGLGEGAR